MKRRLLSLLTIAALFLTTINVFVSADGNETIGVGWIADLTQTSQWSTTGAGFPYDNDLGPTNTLVNISEVNGPAFKMNLIKDLTMTRGDQYAQTMWTTIAVNLDQYPYLYTKFKWGDGCQIDFGASPAQDFFGAVALEPNFDRIGVLGDECRRYNLKEILGVGGQQNTLLIKFNLWDFEIQNTGIAHDFIFDFIFMGNASPVLNGVSMAFPGEEKNQGIGWIADLTQTSQWSTTGAGFPYVNDLGPSNTLVNISEVNGPAFKMNLIKDLTMTRGDQIAQTMWTTIAVNLDQYPYLYTKFKWGEDCQIDFGASPAQDFFGAVALEPAFDRVGVLGDEYRRYNLKEILGVGGQQNTLLIKFNLWDNQIQNTGVAKDFIFDYLFMGTASPVLNGRHLSLDTLQGMKNTSGIGWLADFYGTDQWSTTGAGFSSGYNSISDPDNTLVNISNVNGAAFKMNLIKDLTMERGDSIAQTVWTTISINLDQYPYLYTKFKWEDDCQIDFAASPVQDFFGATALEPAFDRVGVLGNEYRRYNLKEILGVGGQQNTLLIKFNLWDNQIQNTGIAKDFIFDFMFMGNESPKINGEDLSFPVTEVPDTNVYEDIGWVARPNKTEEWFTTGERFPDYNSISDPDNTLVSIHDVSLPAFKMNLIWDPTKGRGQYDGQSVWTVFAEDLDQHPYLYVKFKWENDCQIVFFAAADGNFYTALANPIDGTAEAPSFDRVGVLGNEYRRYNLKELLGVSGQQNHIILKMDLFDRMLPHTQAPCDFAFDYMFMGGELPKINGEDLSFPEDTEPVDNDYDSQNQIGWLADMTDNAWKTDGLNVATGGFNYSNLFDSTESLISVHDVNGPAFKANLEYRGVAGTHGQQYYHYTGYRLSVDLDKYPYLYVRMKLPTSYTVDFTASTVNDFFSGGLGNLQAAGAYDEVKLRGGEIYRRYHLKEVTGLSGKQIIWLKFTLCDEDKARNQPQKSRSDDFVFDYMFIGGASPVLGGTPLSLQAVIDSKNTSGVGWIADMTDPSKWLTTCLDANLQTAQCWLNQSPSFLKIRSVNDPAFTLYLDKDTNSYYQTTGYRCTVDLDQYPYLYSKIKSPMGGSVVLSVTAEADYYATSKNSSENQKYFDTVMIDGSLYRRYRLQELLDMTGKRDLWIKITVLNLNYDEQDFVFDYVFIGNENPVLYGQQLSLDTISAGGTPINPDDPVVKDNDYTDDGPGSSSGTNDNSHSNPVDQHTGEADHAGDNGDDPEISAETGELTEESLQKAILNATGNTVRFRSKTPGFLTSAMQQLLKESGKTLRFEILDQDGETLLIWEFTGMDAIQDDIDLRVDFITKYDKSIYKIVGKKNKTILLSFRHSGALPGVTNIFVRNAENVFSFNGKPFEKNDDLSLYLLDEQAEKLNAEKIPTGLIQENKYVAFSITHCSVYAVSSFKAAAIPLLPNGSSPISAWMIVVPCAAALVLGSGAAVWIILKKRKKAVQKTV